MEKVVKIMTQVKPPLRHKPVKYNNKIHPKIFWVGVEHAVMHEQILHKQKMIFYCGSR